jgi:hypothetical protein
MPENQEHSESIMFMLGEMRADLKYLVTERQRQSQRIDDLEAAHLSHVDEHDERLSKLEHFKTRIGVITGALGIGVPTGLSVLAHKLGLI